MLSAPAKLLVALLRRAFPRAFQNWTRHVYWWWLVGMQEDTFASPQVRVGRHTYGVRKGSVHLGSDEDEVVIGNYCSIAQGVRFVFGEHSLARVSTFPLRTLLGGSEKNVDAVSKGRIVVGHDVWIGTNALILSGVTIGDGAVVGAGAVVTRDVPPYAVAAGVPARVIKTRRTPGQIEDLRRIAWWDWPDERIRANMDLFYGDVSAFIRAHLGDAAVSLNPAPETGTRGEE